MAKVLPVVIAAPGSAGLNLEQKFQLLGPEWLTNAKNTILTYDGRVGARKGWVSTTTTGLPSEGGNTYATWDPETITPGTPPITFTNGDLTATRTLEFAQSVYASVRSTIGVTEGKWYWELTLDSPANDGVVQGIGTEDVGTQSVPGEDLDGDGHGFQAQLSAVEENYYNGGSFSTVGDTVESVQGDVISVLLDLDSVTKTITWWWNGAEVYSATVLNAETYYAVLAMFYEDTVITANFGDSAFEYEPPVGYNQGLYEEGEGEEETPINVVQLHEYIR